MAIARGLSGNNLEQLLSELNADGQTEGKLLQESQYLPQAGELLSPDLALDADWTTITVEPPA